MKLLIILMTMIQILTVYKPAFLDDPDFIWEHYGSERRAAELTFEEIADHIPYECTPYEIEYFARVVEAESNRAGYMSEGKIHIAACVWDRVFSSSWPNTISGVLSQSGQFETTSGGACPYNWTVSSLAAVIEAYERIYASEIPINIIYFNCVGYNNGWAYDYIGGNYFMTSGEPAYYIPPLDE